VESVDVKKSGEAASSTERIEKALLQVVMGSTGLIHKMESYASDHPYYRSIPVLNIWQKSLGKRKFGLLMLQDTSFISMANAFLAHTNKDG